MRIHTANYRCFLYFCAVLLPFQMIYHPDLYYYPDHPDSKKLRRNIFIGFAIYLASFITWLIL